jgi:hypothetical protein
VAGWYFDLLLSFGAVDEELVHWSLRIQLIGIKSHMSIPLT